jgi:hemerythrin-like metal-binding protein
MTVYFKWLTDYSSGNNELDEQNQYLFRLANDIQFADASEAEIYAGKLYHYATKHFTLEEKYLFEIKSPHLTSHLKLHNKILAHFISVAGEGSYDVDTFERLKSFVMEWIVVHFLYHDLKALQHIKSSGK